MLRIVATALLLLVASSPAFGQWTWLNPKPQGHTLNDVEFLSASVAIAVGQAGTVMVTHDAGLTWSWKSRVAGVTANLNAVARVDDHTAIAVGASGTIVKSTDSGATWYQMPSGTGPALTDVDFEAGIAVAVGNGVIRRSTDDGESWSAGTMDFSVQLVDVDVVSGSVTVAVGDYFFLRSDDGGATFARTFVLHPTRAVAFSDQMNGVFSGLFSYFFTSDGGQTWDERPGPDLGSHHEVEATEIILNGINDLFVAASAGGCDQFMVCISAGHLLISTDGATSWQYEWGNRPLNGLDRNSAGVVLLVGDAGNIYRWSAPDWVFIGGSPYDRFDDAVIDLVDATTGIVVGSQFPLFQSNFESVLLRTSDGGANWTPKNLWGYSIVDVAYAGGAPSLVYAISPEISGGNSGRLVKSTDGGANWALVAPTPTLNALEFQSATRGIAVGVSGTVAVIDNDAVTTSTVGGAGNLNGIAFADVSLIVAVGGNTNPAMSTIVRTLDAGATWELVPHDGGATFSSVDFATTSIGAAVGNGGRIAHTDDGGATWDPIVSPTTQHLSAVSFWDESFGLAVGNQGTVLETRDGGLTWTLLESPTSVGLTDVKCVGPFHAMMTGWDLIVLEYRQTPLPTLISSFGADASPFSVELVWAVRDEANLAEFRIERSDAEGGRTFRDIAGSSRAFRDDSVVPGATYEYVLVAVDRDGAEMYSAPVRATTSRAELALLPNVPNPFNPSTTIRYVLPTRKRVRVSIYDISGRLVTTLVDREEAAGSYGVEWKGRDAADNQVSSGVYLVRIEAGKQSVSRKMVLLK